MPNWCENEMVVKGDPERVAEFVEQMKGLTEDNQELLLDFEAVLPMPRVLSGRKSPSDDGSPTWYDWQTENWGVKWGACESRLNYDDDVTANVAIYNYDTPWGPAIPWQEAVVKCFPWLTFEFEWKEWGMMFAGSQQGENGKIVQTDERELTEEDFVEVFGEIE